MAHNSVGLHANLQLFQRLRHELWLGKHSDKQFEELENVLIGGDVQGVALFWVSNWQPVGLILNQ